MESGNGQGYSREVGQESKEHMLWERLKILNLITLQQRRLRGGLIEV